MTRVKSIAQRRHRKIKKATKGFGQARRRRIKAGREAALHAGQYAYIGRKDKKRDLRKLWIMRINAAARENGLTYGQFVARLKKEKIELDRKILADIAVSDPATFKKIVEEIK
jgi:large subunit ribosomal protein L20